MRFGPFELDSVGRELRRNGLRLKITGQPLEVLCLLLERPGTAVARKEIFERLWAADTFVDFEHSLNTAVKRLRSALGDDPQHPKYIETIPKYGYRFIGVVLQDEPQTEAGTALLLEPPTPGGWPGGLPEPVLESGNVPEIPGGALEPSPVFQDMPAQADGDLAPFIQPLISQPGAR